MPTQLPNRVPRRRINRDIRMAEEKKLILEAIAGLQGEHDQISAEMIAAYVQMRHEIPFSSEVVGNRLRILKARGAVQNIRKNNKNFWILTGKPEIIPEDNYMGNVHLPISLIHKIDVYCDIVKITLSQFIRIACVEYLKYLEKIKFSSQGTQFPMSEYTKEEKEAAETFSRFEEFGKKKS